MKRAQNKNLQTEKKLLKNERSASVTHPARTKTSVQKTLTTVVQKKNPKTAASKIIEKISIDAKKTKAAETNLQTPQKASAKRLDKTAGKDQKINQSAAAQPVKQTLPSVSNAKKPLAVNGTESAKTAIVKGSTGERALKAAAPKKGKKLSKASNSTIEEKAAVKSVEIKKVKNNSVSSNPVKKAPLTAKRLSPPMAKNKVKSTEVITQAKAPGKKISSMIKEKSVATVSETAGSGKTSALPVIEAVKKSRQAAVSSKDAQREKKLQATADKKTGIRQQIEIKPQPKATDGLVSPVKKKIKPIGAAVVRGRMGRYDFEIFPLDAEIKDGSAIYVISKRITDKLGRGHHKFVCIGQTESLIGELKKHKKDKCIKQHNANVICLLREEDEKSRLKIENDLREAHTIFCNQK